MTPGRAWSYWRVYGAADELDHISVALASMVGDLPEQSVRWFFLRYADGGGTHVRFRFRATPDDADRIFLARGGIGRRVETDLYEPETTKWGRGPALEAAEWAFQRSSELAVAALRAGEDRLRVARSVLREALARLVPAPETRRGMLETHATWWLGGHGPGTAVYRDALRESARARSDSSVGGAAESEDVRALVDAFGSAMGAADASHPPLYHLHQHLHLTMNRLGLGPREEALVALGAIASPAQEGEP